MMRMNWKNLFCTLRKVNFSVCFLLFLIINTMTVGGRKLLDTNAQSGRQLQQQNNNFFPSQAESQEMFQVFSVQRSIDSNPLNAEETSMETAALAAQFTSTEPEFVIVVLKSDLESSLTKMRAICSDSKPFFQRAQERYGWPDSCHMPGQCIHIFEYALKGAYGTFTWQNVLELEANCLQDEISYFEVDSSVTKSEGAPEEENQQEDLNEGTLLSPSAEEDSIGDEEASNNSSSIQSYLDESGLEQNSSILAANETVKWGKSQSQFVWDGEDDEVSEADKEKMQVMGQNAAEYIDSKTWHPDALYQASLREQFSREPSVATQSVGYKLQRIPEAFWNLDRVDQRLLPLDGQYTYGGQNMVGTGKDVTIYVIDSGIRASHQEFTNQEGDHVRAIAGPDFVDDDDDGDDCDGHGTHVASTAVGRAVGMAKEANVVGVRVLDCRGQGRVGNLIAGIDWVLANIHGPSVATLSLGIQKGEGSKALEEAVTAMSADYNVVTVVASGNLATDSCNIVPANIPETITVAASDLPTKFGQTGYLDVETMYQWGNTGKCVDIFAPGVGIYAACGGDSRCELVHDAAYTWADGTSMAVPHVAAAAAIFLGEIPTATPTHVKAVITGIASLGKIQSSNMLPETPNRLLYVNLEEMINFYYQHVNVQSTPISTVAPLTQQPQQQQQSQQQQQQQVQVTQSQQQQQQQNGTQQQILQQNVIQSQGGP
eukprot:TRINITY_DN2255_c1_g1_i3.p1 TRINITY_DN2255_c1_g1~~TRINITY_DN2255_c1_g1_i3.p1  ORF type:complete len:714 (+),score=100.25 TRINITY_DN2255_c1_g1_i3:672-2813(+)